MPSRYFSTGTLTNLLTTELNSLANGSSQISRVGGSGSNGIFNNSGNIYPYGAFELLQTFGIAPSATTGMMVWLLASIDGGTNFEDGSASIVPARVPDFYITPRNVTTAQRQGQKIIKLLPPGPFKLLLQNNSGQTLAASGNILRYLPFTDVYQ